MVVWVYAGGGYAEAHGLIPFLQRHFASYTFQRRTPALRKPGPRPGVAPAAAGRPARTYAGSTGKALTDEVKDDIARYWDGRVELVLLLDDSDCDPPEPRIAALVASVQTALAARGIAGDAQPPAVAGLAVPELEAWPLGDWAGTFQKEYGKCAGALRHDLPRRGVSLDAPESFNCRPDDNTYLKLSEELIAAVESCCQARFSKATDTPRLLQQADPAQVRRRCPYFNQLWAALEKAAKPAA